jgi:methyl-accepting chemotaxis protein
MFSFTGLGGFLSSGDKTMGARLAELESKSQAISRSQAVVELSLDGTVLDANPLFLGALGYTLEEVRGRHHRMFVDPKEAASADYAAFWRRLGQGEFDSGQYRRIGKDGREVWIQASYNPVLDERGRPYKVIKFASDITQQKLHDSYSNGQLDAIHRVMAVIEFALDGTILQANENFLAVMGYTLSEVQGRHHSMFVAPDYANSSEYPELWSSLGKGECRHGQFLRFGKDGREVWIEASYNPIRDAAGRPFRVVKYATDVTARARLELDFRNQMSAINAAQAVIEFTPDGTVLTANSNFLQATGYSLEEIRGRHHRMFVRKEDQQSPAYQALWDMLARGEADSGRYRRVTKSGGDLWLQASYNPIVGRDGRPYKVVKYATDITPFLRQVMGEVRGLAEQIASGAREIATGNSDLSSRTEQQAAALEETASSMEELAATVKHNAESAQEASRLSALAAETAGRSGEAVGQVVGTMQTISAQSRRIEDIIGVIDGIAFQTNILALNAAVEAARAGEQGRGFAVVAGEVRTLAQRSAAAAKDIKALIHETSSQVQAGSRLVEVAGRTMGELAEAVQRANRLIGQIDSASAEQSTGIRQVATMLTQLDDTTQRNAALVEEIAASATGLDHQSDALFALVSQYTA